MTQTLRPHTWLLTWMCECGIGWSVCICVCGLVFPMLSWSNNKSRGLIVVPFWQTDAVSGNFTGNTCSVQDDRLFWTRVMFILMGVFILKAYFNTSAVLFCKVMSSVLLFGSDEEIFLLWCQSTSQLTWQYASEYSSPYIIISILQNKVRKKYTLQLFGHFNVKNWRKKWN